MYKVYECSRGDLYSDGVTKAFGENRTIKTGEDSAIFASVQPLMVDPKEFNFKIIGEIK